MNKELTNIIYIGMGSIIGATFRYVLSNRNIINLSGYNTVLINIIASILIGKFNIAFFTIRFAPYCKR